MRMYRKQWADSLWPGSSTLGTSETLTKVQTSATNSISHSSNTSVWLTITHIATQQMMNAAQLMWETIMMRCS